MLWVLWDIFLPIIAAFLVGLLVGWMLWRWRRSRVDAESLASVRRSASRFKTDADNLRIRNAELSDRLQVASGAGQADSREDQTELARARKRIDVLSAELKTSRQQIDQLRKAGTPAESVNRVRELEAKLHGAQRRIADLEQNAGNMATGVANDSTLKDAIKARDDMIATLKTSLDQFGSAKDNTALEACVALRDRKITALENLLEQSNERL